VIHPFKYVLKFALIASLSTLPANLCAQRETIHFDPATKVFRIDAGDITYAFGVNNVDELQPLYWGRHISAADKLPSAHTEPEMASFDGSGTVTQGEYKGWGGELYLEPDLKVTSPDGNRDLVLHYISYTIKDNELIIITKDIERELYVELHYIVDPETGILGRSAVIKNGTKASVTVEEAAAATWNLPRGTDYTLRYLTGRWAGEGNLQQQPIVPGETVLQSRRGSTGHQNNPWFAIERGAGSDEDSGDVWFGALAWSGSWRITVEQDQLQQVRVTGGFNPFDFGYKLAPGQTLETPVFYGGYSHHGIGGAY
jgi:alpha-galactosidase